MMRHSRVSHVQRLESRALLTAVGFETHAVSDSDAPYPTSAIWADLDGDADLDFVVASQSKGEIGWYLNFGDKLNEEYVVVSKAATAVSEMIAADIDGDSDFDLVVAGSDNRLAWLENVDGRGRFSPSRVIGSFSASSRYAAVDQLRAVDVDNDGDVDLLARVAGTLGGAIFQFRNIDGEGMFREEPINSGSRGLGFDVGDVNGDGTVDYVYGTASGTRTTRIRWAANDGSGQYTGGTVAFERRFDDLQSLTLGDLDGDQDLDVLIASKSDNLIAWYPNLGDGQFGTQIRIDASIERANEVIIFDVDADGDHDFVAAGEGRNDRTISWFENTDGVGGFVRRDIAASLILEELGAADADGDGDLDLSAASWRGQLVGWFENTDGLGTFGELLHLDADYMYLPTATEIVDLNGDDQTDILSATFDGKLLWTERPGTSTQVIHEIGQEDGVVETIDIADMDLDGDFDVVTATRSGSVVWYENHLPNGAFVRHEVDDSIGQTSATAAFDVDGDGRPDIVVGGRTERRLTWFRNGESGFERAGQIPTSNRFFDFLASVDFDGDGDLDLVTDFGWHENRDGNGDFSAEAVATDTVIKTIVDFDHDGDPDLLGVQRNAIVWLENSGGELSAPRQLSLGQYQALQVADFNADGEWDVVATQSADNSDVKDNIVMLLGTESGRIRESGYIVSSVLERVKELHAYDVDRDGQLDLISAGSELHWHHSRVLGDANGDGVFDQQDLVLVFQAGGYEDALVNNSNFETGDWNNDGEFSTADLVAVFIAGGFR